VDALFLFGQLPINGEPDK